MLRKLLAALGFASATAKAASPPYSAYASRAANDIYNLLFCDDLTAYLAKPGETPAQWQRTLASDPADIDALQALAADSEQEGRVRFLACRRLRETGQSVPSKQLFGVIVEMPQRAGLDTLAAYSEGGVRYVNQSGKIAVVEATPLFDTQVKELFAAAQPVVDAIGPWDGVRRAPPARGGVRLSFLVSDGLHFGEGPLSEMGRDPMAAPVLGRATELLQAVVATLTK